VARPARTYSLIALTALLAAILATAFIPAGIAHAQNPYVGGYYAGSPELTDDVVMLTAISVPDVNAIPPNNRVSSVLSVAGAYTDSEGNVYISGLVYQSSYIILSGGQALLAINIWNATTPLVIVPKQLSSIPSSVTEEITINATHVIFAFATDGQVAWVIAVPKYKVGAGDPDNYLLTGTYNGYMFLQFGTEAIENPANCAWSVYQKTYYLTYDPYSGEYYYTWSDAYSTQGSQALIVPPGAVIGGADYPGVNYNYYPSNSSYDVGVLEWYWEGGNYYLQPGTYLFSGPGG